MTKNNRVVFLADDHKIVADGLSAVINQHNEVAEVFTYANGKELISALESQQADLVFFRH